MRLQHTLSLNSLVVYAPIEEGLWCAKLLRTPRSTPYWTSIPITTCLFAYEYLRVNATTVIDRVCHVIVIDYELCVGPHISGIENDNNSHLLSFARFKRLICPGSWYQK